jgi:hypothetical protein
MKKIGILTLSLAACWLLFSASSADSAPTVQIKDINQRASDTNFKGILKPDIDFGKIPLYFITNQGQVNKRARFYAKTSRYTLWLTKEGLVFDSTKRPEARGQKSEKTKHTSLQRPNASTFQRDVSRLMFLGANKDPNIIPVNETKLRVNFFKGNDPTKWVGDIPTSQAVLYKNLYTNIDLKVYGIEKQIEYDWIVRPGGNPEDIRFEYKDVKKTRIDRQGNLVITTTFGELIHKKPVSFQEIREKLKIKKEKVKANFKKISKNTYGFEVGEYDKNKKLIIDPVVLAYSTYLGGSNVDRGQGIAVDGNGYVYVGGETASTDFPTLNQYQGDQTNMDAFVSKLDTTQNGAASLIYSTYIGGSGSDRSYDLAVDANGCAYVVGITSSADYPTLNQYQGDQTGTDAFVSKLDTTQSGLAGLVYSSYLGGDNDDHAYGVAVEGTDVYVAGYTRSTDYPTLNQYQGYQPGADAYVTKLDTTQSGTASLLYSTYLGGGDEDYGVDVIADGSGYAYASGYTWSTDYPTLNQYQGDPGDSNTDGFVTKLDTTQSGAASLLYSTYLGGNNSDQAIRVGLDSNGYTYVTGHTSSWNYPVLNQYQSDQGGQDVFVTKLDTTKIGNASLLYSTYLGGSSAEDGRSLAIDSSDYVYVTGYTGSSDFPTLNQFQADQGSYDAFVTKLDTTKSGSSCLLYSTYLGGSDFDMGHGIAVDSNGNAYVTGETNSTDFPTFNQYQVDPGDTSYDGFVSKLINPSINITSPNGGESYLIGSNLHITWSAVLENPGELVNISLIKPNGRLIKTFARSISADLGYYDQIIPTYLPAKEYKVRIEVIGAGLYDESDGTFTVTASPYIILTSPNGGENWQLGSSQNITWTATSGMADLLKITLLKDCVPIGVIATNVDPASGSFTWTVGLHSGGTATAGTGYRVKIRIKNTNRIDISDLVFDLSN